MTLLAWAVGGFIAIGCIGGGGLLTIAYVSLCLEERQTRRRLEQIYLNARAWQMSLDTAYVMGDELDQVHCLEFLEALAVEALSLHGLRDDGSDEADIVRDLIYADVTPAETRQRLAAVRAAREESWQ
jgi:hypothetical protein